MGEIISSEINGIHIRDLTSFKDDRGQVMHMMRSNSPHFKQFGEVYFSFTKPGIIKGWKRHHIIEQNFAVPVGNMKIVMFDDRPHSPTKNCFQTVIIGVDNYKLLTIPPLVWYAFTPVGGTEAMIANCTTHPHDPSESETKPLDTYKFV